MKKEKRLSLAGDALSAYRATWRRSDPALVANLCDWLASAAPYPIEHPTMAAAWAEARLYLDEYEGKR